jgi:hypothetical protein
MPVGTLVDMIEFLPVRNDTVRFVPVSQRF